jgi:hypothetical protein
VYKNGIVFYGINTVKTDHINGSLILTSKPQSTEIKLVSPGTIYNLLKRTLVNQATLGKTY